MNVAVGIIVAPLFFMLMFFANTKQDINLIQAQWRASDSERVEIRRLISCNSKYKFASISMYISIPVGMLSAVAQLLGFIYLVYVGASVLIILLIVGIFYRVAGFMEIYAKK